MADGRADGRAVKQKDGERVGAQADGQDTAADPAAARFADESRSTRMSANVDDPRRHRRAEVSCIRQSTVNLASRFPGFGSCFALLEQQQQRLRLLNSAAAVASAAAEASAAATA